MSSRNHWAAGGLAALLLLGPAAHADEDPAQRQSIEELRNTVINLLQALVDKGLLTREQAQLLVKQATDKAAADEAALAAKNAAQAKEEENAVRVPYVPQIVKDEISKQVATELAPTVQQQVAAQLSPANVHSALPDWVQRMNWTGDVRIRAEADDYGRGNAPYSYLDFNAVNAAGGVVNAGTKAYLDTNYDVDRLRIRLRFGFDTDLGDGWSSGMRIATGNGGEIYVSTNQTFGTYGDAYQIALDQGWVRWTGQSSSGRQIFTTAAGRFSNPWLSTNMVWYNDLTFEGLTSNYRVNLSSDNAHRQDIYATVGAFPLQSETPSSRDKWLAGAQIGADLQSEDASRLRFGAAYYDYIHINGVRNSPDSTFWNFTAPALVQKGNTMYDISNSNNPDTNLFALAADYRIVDLIAIAEWHAFTRYAFSLTGDAVKNIGYSAAEVLARTGTYVPPRTAGYEADVGFGSFAYGERNSWRASLGYRYLQRDAVLDAFNDEDFHLGGTDTKGYIVNFDYAVNPHVWARLRYLSATAIDGPPLAIDVLMLDLNTQF